MIQDIPPPLVKFPRAEIRDLIQNLTSAKVIWDNEPHPFVGMNSGNSDKPSYFLELAVKRTETKGIDDDKIVFDPVRHVNTKFQYSYRIYTIEMHVVSYDKDIPAFDVMDQVRRGLRSISAKTENVLVGVAFVDWGKTIDVTVAHDNRNASECKLEVRIAWLVSVDPGDDGGGVIDTVTTLQNQLTT